MLSYSVPFVFEWLYYANHFIVFLAVIPMLFLTVPGWFISKFPVMCPWDVYIFIHFPPADFPIAQWAHCMSAYFQVGRVKLAAWESFRLKSEGTGRDVLNILTRIEVESIFYTCTKNNHVFNEPSSAFPHDVAVGITSVTVCRTDSEIHIHWHKLWHKLWHNIWQLLSHSYPPWLKEYCIISQCPLGRLWFRSVNYCSESQNNLPLGKSTFEMGHTLVMVIEPRGNEDKVWKNGVKMQISSSFETRWDEM